MTAKQFISPFFVVALLCGASQAFGHSDLISQSKQLTADELHLLTERQQSIVPISSFAAAGDLKKLRSALDQGLNAGLTVNEIKEVLTQLYAYAGFPRSLNALGLFMEVVADRKDRGVKTVVGDVPSMPIPKGDELLKVGTLNQTQLLGAPVTGALFEFAPAIDEYLKTHLFGDIFARNNLPWVDREIATLAALAAMSGVEPQLKAHVGISMNVGLTLKQLQHLAKVLANQVSQHASQQMNQALEHYSEQQSNN